MVQREDRDFEPFHNKRFFLLYSQTANTWKNTVLLCMFPSFTIEKPAGKSVLLAQQAPYTQKDAAFGENQY